MNFVSRAEWGARPPTGVTAASGLVGTAGHWNGPTVWHGTIGSHASCPIIVRGIQNYHMDAQGWTDVAYGALACPHGYVFEGRGPGIRTAANGTNTANGLASAVCYLGGESDPLTAEGLQAMFDAWLWLTDGDRTGHRDWFNSHCPGDEIYAAYLAGPVPIPPEDDMPPAPDSCVDSQGRVWVVARLEDQAIWARINYSEWFTLGGVALSGPSITATADGYIVVTAVGTDHAVWRKDMTPDGTWSEWFSIGGVVA